jgi:2-polyprenyl-3-methyl-5-hydroxy-6-metoxy-1,4-benzoquinol methylase
VQVEPWDVEYRRYQATLAAQYLIPLLRRWSIEPGGRRVLEVGCGDGGCGAEFFRAGARVTALDIDARLVQLCDALNQREGVSIRTHLGDITDPNCPGLEAGPFDIILVRDVVEHLEDLERALRNLAAHMAQDAVLYVEFPPYYSPFGAHQQILPAKKIGFLPYNKLPYIQLLPGKRFRRLVAGETSANREVLRLRGIRLTLRKFQHQVWRAGLQIRARKLYLSRPSFKLRYGIPVVGASFLGDIPFLNEVLVTGGDFLLARSTGAARRRDDVG